MKARQSLLQHWLGLVRDQNGAVAIEYALIAMIITTAIVAALNSIGAQLGTIFTAVSNGFQGG